MRVIKPTKKDKKTYKKLFGLNLKKIILSDNKVFKLMEKLYEKS